MLRKLDTQARDCKIILGYNKILFFKTSDSTEEWWLQGLNLFSILPCIHKVEETDFSRFFMFPRK